MLLIQSIVCCIIDLSGFIDSIKWLLWKAAAKGVGRPESIRLKPLDCSLCMTFWAEMIFLLCIHQFTLPYIAAGVFMAICSQNVSGLIRLVPDLLAKIENTLSKWIG